MGAEENYKALRAELDKRLSADKRLAAIAEKISAGKADFSDTSRYSQIASHIRGEVISQHIGEITVPLGKQMVYKELLRDHYKAINDILGEVQASVDDKLGIHLKPVKAPFPTERVDTAAHSLEDPTVPEETIKRRARSTTENIANSMHDDYIKENAKTRTQAGLKCYLVRDAGGGCCSWCQGLEGRFDYATAPDDIFRRHDNCTCTVTYECGRQRQDVWSKKTWEATPEELKARKEAEAASKPVVNSKEQAKEIENTILFQAKPGRDDNAIADMEYINSQAYADKFKGKYANEDVENAVVAACRRLISNRNGTCFEEAFFIDANTGKTISYVKGKKKYGIEMSDKLKKDLTRHKDSSIIMIHNHPNSTPPSITDFLTACDYRSCYEALACGHNGDVYAFRSVFGKQGVLLGYIEDNGEKIPYYEGVRDYLIAFDKYSQKYDDIKARNLAWSKTSELRRFGYEKR